MADVWDKYITEEDQSVPAIAEKGAGKFAIKHGKSDDPWAKYFPEDIAAGHNNANEKVLPFLEGVEKGGAQKYPKEELPNWVKNWIQKPLEPYLGKPEDSPNPLTVTKEIGKGIPIAGHYIPQDEDMTRMEKTYPKATTLARGSGAVMSTAPLSYGAGLLTGTAGNLTRANMLPAIGAQGSLGAGLGAADVIAEKGKDVTARDIMDRGSSGGLWGAAGPIASKMLSPGSIVSSIRPPPAAAPHVPQPPRAPTVAPPPETQFTPRHWTNFRSKTDMANDPMVKFMAERQAVSAAKAAEQHAAEQARIQAAHVAAEQARVQAAEQARVAARGQTQQSLGSIRAPSTHNDTMQGIMTRMLMAGVPAHYAGGGSHPLLTGAAAAAAAIGPHTPALAAKYWHNINMLHPGSKDIINALMTNQGIGQ